VRASHASPGNAKWLASIRENGIISIRDQQGVGRRRHQGVSHQCRRLGTCTFHEYTALSPNRAETVRAHNWVIIGGLVPKPDQPATFLPATGRLYFRKSQLPPGEKFQTKCEQLVAAVLEQACEDGPAFGRV
jgi:hypothetical protein